MIGRGETCLAGEGDKVVLTQTGDVYVSYEDHLVVIFREDSIVYDIWVTKRIYEDDTR